MRTPSIAVSSLESQCSTSYLPIKLFSLSLTAGML